MPKKDIRYYINTINLKCQAAIYHLLDKLSLLDRMKKREATYFSNLYDTHFKKEIELNDSFSTEYKTYLYFPVSDDYARNLLFDTEEVAFTAFLATANSDNKSVSGKPFFLKYKNKPPKKPKSNKAEAIMLYVSPKK